jgi:hypothetical protein
MKPTHTPQPSTAHRPSRLTVTPPKPRNPLVAAARQRRAGAHRAGPGAVRQRLQSELRAELQRARHDTGAEPPRPRYSP